MKIAVDVCMGNVGVAMLRADGHEVLEAEHAEADRDWFSRAKQWGVDLVVSGDNDLNNLCWKHDVKFIRAERDMKGPALAARVIDLLTYPPIDGALLRARMKPKKSKKEPGKQRGVRLSGKREMPVIHRLARSVAEPVPKRDELVVALAEIPSAREAIDGAKVERVAYTNTPEFWTEVWKP